MTLKEKLTPNIWVWEKLWKVVEIFELDDTTYILLKNTTHKYPEMALIDAYDTIFYTDTKEVRSKMEEFKKFKKLCSGIESDLEEIWIDFLNDV